ncbi:unnamed protein product [Ilex paraguariensis]|uniref:Uncharacterized protein n=1 Tax=Ilex paraguariensis TaxID=185542 RepID=A0ABC8SR91_9AQUA
MQQRSVRDKTVSASLVVGERKGSVIGRRDERIYCRAGVDVEKENGYMNIGDLHRDIRGVRRKCEFDFHFSDSGSKQKFTSSSPPCHVVFKYLVPLLAALVTMQYQSKGKDPFEARPINMWCFCIATSIYCLAMGIRNQIQTPKYLQILLSHVILVAGVLSSVSLGSVILPPRFRGQLIIFAVLVFLPIILARNILKRGYVWIYNGVTNVAALIIPNVVIGWNVTAEPNPSQPA